MKDFKFYSIVKGFIIASMMIFITYYLSVVVKGKPLEAINGFINSKEPNISTIITSSFVGEVIFLLIFLLAILFYNILVSTHNIKISEYYFYTLVQSVMKSDFKWHLLFLSIMMAADSFLITPKYSGILLIFLSYIWLIIFLKKYLFLDKNNLINVRSSIKLFDSLIIKLIYIIFVLIRNLICLVYLIYRNNRLTRANTLGYSEKHIFLYSFLTALVVAIFNKEISMNALAFLQFAINLSLLTIVVTVKHIYKIINVEYKSANIEKQITMNRYVINNIYKSLNEEDQEELKQAIQNKRFKTLYYSFINKEEFQSFVYELSLDEKLKSKIKSIYGLLIIDYLETSNQLGEIIKKRNHTNFSTSIFLILFSFAMVPVMNLFEYNKSDMNLVLKSLLCVVLIRLIMRSIEIGYAFFFDIKPDARLKKTNLNNGHRIKLVIFSLLEVTLISSLLYILAKVIALKQIDFYMLMLIYLENIKYAFAVAFFNVSFPLAYLDEIYESINMDYWSLPNVIRLVHLTQIIISILLISLSVTSYGSKSQRSMPYNLAFVNGTYFINEVDVKNNIFRELFNSKSIDGLKENILITWKDGKINSNQYLRLNELIDIYAKKNFKKELH